MKSVLIIGIGRFGHHLCIDMANRGNEVMIIDKDEKKTTDLLEYATAVRVGDCTNEEVLRSLGVGKFRSLLCVHRIKFPEQSGDNKPGKRAWSQTCCQ